LKEPNRDKEKKKRGPVFHRRRNGTRKRGGKGGGGEKRRKERRTNDSLSRGARFPRKKKKGGSYLVPPRGGREVLRIFPAGGERKKEGTLRGGVCGRKRMWAARYFGTFGRKEKRGKKKRGKEKTGRPQSPPLGGKLTHLISSVEGKERGKKGAFVDLGHEVQQKETERAVPRPYWQEKRKKKGGEGIRCGRPDSPMRGKKKKRKEQSHHRPSLHRKKKKGKGRRKGEKGTPFVL